MAPLVNEFIPAQIDLIFAFFIGVFFGYVLEQAGFSSSKRLVGLFYGYDFTVLRVFFTAGLTAMIGVIILTHFGLLNIDLVYINPLFVWSAIVGGFIMGLGFVIGGYCPGTSVCAAAIGKIDAMYFVLGGFLGVLFFGETYSMWERIYLSANLGNPFIFDTLGISRELVAIIFVIVAVTAFILVTKLENKVNPNNENDPTPKQYYRYIFAGVVVLIIILPFMHNKKDYLLEKVEDVDFVKSQNYNIMTVDEFAYRIWDRDKKLIPVDLRTPIEYKSLQLPNSHNITLSSLFERSTYKKLNKREYQLVFFANDEITAKKAVYIASQLGYKNIYVLKDGIGSFVDNYLNFKPQEIPKDANKLIKDTYRFREMASKELPKIIEESKPKEVKEEKAKRVLGGC